MLDKYIKLCLYKLNKDNHYSDIQLEEITYSIKVISGDISKFIILITLFSLLHYQFEFLYAFITTALLRIYIGGKHLKTYHGCLLFSSIYFSILIILSKFLAFEYKQHILLISIVSIIILLLIAPQISRKSGRKCKKNRYHIKLIILVLVTLYLIIFIRNKEPIYTIGPLTIIFQSIQLLIMKGENNYEIKKERKTGNIYS